MKPFIRDGRSATVDRSRSVANSIRGIGQAIKDRQNEKKAEKASAEQTTYDRELQARQQTETERHNKALEDARASSSVGKSGAGTDKSTESERAFQEILDGFITENPANSDAAMLLRTTILGDPILDDTGGVNGKLPGNPEFEVELFRSIYERAKSRIVGEFDPKKETSVIGTADDKAWIFASKVTKYILQNARHFGLEAASMERLDNYLNARFTGRHGEQSDMQLPGPIDKSGQPLQPGPQPDEVGVPGLTAPPPRDPNRGYRRF
jgi:hypothetical protein